MSVAGKNKIIVPLSFFLLIYFHSAFPLFQQISDIEDVQIKAVAISGFDSKLVYAASKNSLYKSQDAGKSFQKVNVFKDEPVQQIFYDSYLADTLYIVTTRHLYRLNNKLEQLFYFKDEQVIYAAAKNKGTIYIGTNQGLYFADDSSFVWKRPNGLRNLAIYYIEPKEDNLYLATEKGVYIFKEDDSLQRVFVMRKDEEEGREALLAKVIRADIFDENRFWLGTNRGLFISEDKGLNWKKVYIGGIDNLGINSIAQTRLQDNAIYLATTKGFFRVNFTGKTSKQIFEGLSSSYIWWVEFTSRGKIYLATSKGLFSNNYFTNSYKSYNFNNLLEGEPSIGQIQQACLNYNEVHPDKIKAWRKSLKIRAFFPNVSLDYDKTINYDSGVDRYYVGPYDWGVSFSWNIGNLIWNSYEDDVDTRSRLDTQLRLDILDEINRVYYERLRIKRRLLVDSLSEEELFKNSLRLEELTATLDGYCGGYFSQRIKELNEKE